ncbi:MAG TPA: CHAT domain-containing tetratricopeptide repeat protein [Blastocatellia bacterium]|nr:CHAT domain-containing tetratricopeptide repeat protein [Blastocatellia bacterium]
MNTKCFNALLIFSLCGGVVEATRRPQDLQSLSVGAPIERELSGGQTHAYRIALSAGQYALAQVEQRGVNVALTANAPDGKEFAIVDLRWGNEGVESLAILADRAGEYILKVTSRHPSAASGLYEVKIGELRAATEQDRARVKAQTISYEARALSLEPAPEAKRKAAQLYEEAALLWRRIPDPLWESALLWRLGRLHIDLTEFRQAKDYFSRAVIVWRAIGDRRGEVSAQNGVCESLHYLGDMKGKAECLDALIPIYRELGARLEEAKVVSNKAVTFNSLGDYQAALQSAQQALRIFQEEGDRVQESFALNTLGQIYRSLNEQQLALDHYERALAIRREGTDKRLLGLTLGDIGVTYSDLGDDPRAIDYFRQAIAISEELGDRRTKAIRLQGLGMIWKRMGEMTKALDAQTQSLALAREVGDRQAEGRTLISMSELHLLQGEKEKARDDLIRALELLRDAGDPVGEASVLTKMGNMAADGGDWRQAINLLQQSFSLARKTGDIQRERDALVALAQTERERNNLSAARDYHEKALDLTESFRAKILRQELRASFLASRQEEYELYMDLLMQLHQQQPDGGHAAAAFGISERGRARSLLETLAEARANIRQGVDAGLLAEERKLADQIRLKEQQRAKLAGNSRAAKQTEALAGEIGELLSEYQSIQGHIRAASPRFAALTQPQPVTAAEIQTEYLDSSTVLLEFALGDERSWLWAITPDAMISYALPPRAQIEKSARKIYEMLTARQPKKDLTEAEQLKRTAEADAKLQAETATLSRMLFGPISAQLRHEWKDKRLAVVASGALEYVPLAALPLPEPEERRDGEMERTGRRGDGATGRNGKSRPVAPRVSRPVLLIADHEIVNLPSASTLAALRRETVGRQPAAKTLAVIADPVFEPNDPRVLASAKKNKSNDNLAVNVQSTGESPPPVSSTTNSALRRATRSFNRGGFSRLPFSREEADNIAELIPKSSLFKVTDFQANRKAATSGQLSGYRIIHFATHGLLNSEHPELSGLVLSLVDANGKTQDGFLRMDEIFNLQLPADLVVLSACQTALGQEIKGEGLIGLTRGFMYAGAQRVMASLWQVDDQATAQLMQYFYRGMLKENLRPAAALRAAQIEMSKQKRWSAPYYWAGFVIQGEWR